MIIEIPLPTLQDPGGLQEEELGGWI